MLLNNNDDYFSATGETFTLKYKQVIFFATTTGPQDTHKITVENVSSVSATLTIESTPITAVLTKGQPQKFDVNNDSVLDIEIEFVDKVLDLAELRLKALPEGTVFIPTPTVSITVKPSITPTTNLSGLPQTGKDSGSTTAQSGSTFFALALISAIVGLIVLAVLILKKKKKAEQIESLTPLENYEYQNQNQNQNLENSSGQISTGTPV